MDMPVDEDWKKNVGFPINYSTGSSDDDFDCKDVVFRNPRQSDAILADCGDGAEADMLGTTPPRSRIRKKEKLRRRFDPPVVQRMPKRDVVDHASPQEHNTPGSDRQLLKKRSSMKQIRTWQRDSKQELGIDVRCDSLPSSNQLPALPTLVDTCSRFMSLTSRPKHREPSRGKSPEPAAPGAGLGSERWRCDGDEELPASRVNFHQTFSLLINMGNIEKGCKRAISREEQVWQNELKDLIWLELQAKLAGRSLAQQDAYLCAQRTIVTPLIAKVLDYKFVNTNPCRRSKQNCDTSSREDLTSEAEQEKINEEEQSLGCLTFECQECCDAIGQAMREVGALLDAFYNAVALYPSSRTMTTEHQLIATPLFKNRIKAMCLWYNTALHMRMKMLAMLRLLRSIKLKGQRRPPPHRASLDSDISRQSSDSRRACQVRFNVSQNPSESSNSESGASAHSDAARETDDGKERPDEVDSGIEAGTTRRSLNTPEIVVSDTYGTCRTDTSASVESECASFPELPVAGAGAGLLQPDAMDEAALAELTQIRLLNKCDVSLYREYHREILKTQGVRRCMAFISKMRTNLLDKVYLTLEKPDSLQSENYDEEEQTEVFDEPKDDSEKQESAHDEDEIKNYELRRYGCWSAECVAMRLPSYRAHFLLLSAICMEAVHDYLSFRLEATPDRPSCLTVKQLIHELREGLDISSEMRANFVRHARAALGGRSCGASLAAPQLRPLLHTYDATVQRLLEQYLSYLTTMSETECMPRACLQAEWAFTARLAKRIPCAAALAPQAFSNITCNQLNRLLKQFDEEFGKLHEDETEKVDPNKETIYAICRSVQSIYAWSRDTALQTTQWARALAARLARAPCPAYVQQRGEMFNCIMAIRDFIVKHIIIVLEKSKSPSADDLPRELNDTFALRVRELLLQIYKLGFELHKELYKFVHGTKLYEDRSLGSRRPISLQPIRRPIVERRKRPETMLVHEFFNPMIHKELHRFVNDTLSARGSPPRRSVTTPPAPAPAPTPPARRAKIIRTDSIVEDYENNVFDERLFDNVQGDGQSIEQLLGEQPAIEEEVELRRAAARRVSSEEKQWAGRVARAVIEFARCWMKFVVERCDRGRGLRPRWASQGLEFLMLACDPCNTKHLSDEEFEELKQLMDGCISHVVGSRPAARAPDLAAPHSPRPRPRLPSPLSGSTSREPPLPASPPTPPSEPADPADHNPLLSYPEAESIAHRERVLVALGRVDRLRDERLRAAKSVGTVLHAAASVAAYEPNKLRQLTFKWQRGLKIGAGTFGKVYTVVNTESGQLLAMKELSIGAGDRRALQRAANELRVLEGVIHPHLVRYYGCELHREEMLLFMELCVEGSLEALVATSGALAEHTTRRYTKQLLSAVAELHARSIAHRDIKSGNIFLTNEGHCLKLGDFGCAVKIRANTTAPGELQGFVGTQAYMAPEVFMKSSGHGRAADIWSLGCVVTEMASGKRPFPEYDSNYQIMFVVGMGGRPEVPEWLSAEGRAFCRACLTHDPDLRPRAEALTLHHFLMVKSDDDCKCEPAYLIT